MELFEPSVVFVTVYIQYHLLVAQEQSEWHRNTTYWMIEGLMCVANAEVSVTLLF